jgi:hypothetical protein
MVPPAPNPRTRSGINVPMQVQRPRPGPISASRGTCSDSRERFKDHNLKPGRPEPIDREAVRPCLERSSGLKLEAENESETGGSQWPAVEPTCLQQLDAESGSSGLGGDVLSVCGRFHAPLQRERLPLTNQGKPGRVRQKKERGLRGRAEERKRVIYYRPEQAEPRVPPPPWAPGPTRI